MPSLSRDERTARSLYRSGGIVRHVVASPWQAGETKSAAGSLQGELSSKEELLRRIAACDDELDRLKFQLHQIRDRIEHVKRDLRRYLRELEEGNFTVR